MVISFVPAANHENREGRFHPAASCDWLLQISDNVIGSDMSRALPVSVARSPELVDGTVAAKQAVTSQRPGERAISPGETRERWPGQYRLILSRISRDAP